MQSCKNILEKDYRIFIQTQIHYSVQQRGPGPMPIPITCGLMGLLQFAPHLVLEHEIISRSSSRSPGSPSRSAAAGGGEKDDVVPLLELCPSHLRPSRRLLHRYSSVSFVSSLPHHQNFSLFPLISVTFGSIVD